MKETVTYGYNPNHDHDTFDPNIYQGQQPSCAVRSQEIICRDYGVAVSQEELIAFAKKNGWYSPNPQNGGTPRDAIGNILDACGIHTTRTENASIYDIISELRAGHRVIVSVDANELWVKNEPNLMDRFFGKITNKLNDKLDDIYGVQGANHALIVAGVNVNPNDPSDIYVTLVDPGTGDVCKVYGLKDFQDAWNDSHRYMVSTDIPAPFQYNYTTGEMEPSNFATSFMPSMVTLPAELHNQFELPESYFVNYSTLEPSYSWTRVIPFWEKTNSEQESKCACVAAKNIDKHEDDNASGKNSVDDGGNESDSLIDEEDDKTEEDSQDGNDDDTYSQNFEEDDNSYSSSDDDSEYNIDELYDY